MRPELRTSCARIARGAVGATVVALCALSGSKDVRGDTAASATTEQGERAFVAIASVLQSPRCMNCHPMGEEPLNGDHAAIHRMNVSRASQKGLNCTTCHRNDNGAAPHSPPGAPSWRLPPDNTRMVFQGRSPHDLCEQLKDPSRNGEKTLPALHEHMAKDPFVMWGWSPGPGRTLPPLSHDEMMKNVDTWISAGAPCPR